MMDERDGQSNRREFFKSSALMLLAGAAPLSRAVEFGKGEKVRVAVVGTGARGSDLIRHLTTLEAVELAALCDDYPPHLKKGLEYAGGEARTFEDYDAMLKQVRPDAVIVAAPLYLHYEMCLKALEAGCAVFCEKTMCYSVEQARELMEAVESRKAVFQVGLQRRANAIYRQAAAMAETGMLGRITAIKCQWHRNDNWRRPVPVSRDHPKWEELERRLNWRLYREYSRGLLAELASHQMDVCNWLLGTTPACVYATGGIDYWRDGREVKDNVFCIYEYRLPVEGGSGGDANSSENPGKDERYTVRVTYSSLQNNAFEGASELVMGVKGTLFLTSKKGLFYQENAARRESTQGADPDAALLTAGTTLKMSNDPWAFRGKPYEIDSESNDTRDELVSFIDCVLRNDLKTLCDARSGYMNALTVLGAHRAMEEGGRVALT